MFMFHRGITTMASRRENAEERRTRLGKDDQLRCVPNFTLHLLCLHCSQAARGGISVETERGAARTVSELTLATVTPRDVGKYSCRPTEGRTDTVMLIVEPG